MSIAIKRKRGRPRRDEPREINDFDLSLIREFEGRPAFYDRTHPQYRNRDFLEPQWLEMARNLGYSVNFLKNRILQLRNRYNLEKRRIDTLQERSNSQEVSSPWILFDHLAFLSDHIKTRRSFANQTMPLDLHDPPILNSSDVEDYDDDCHPHLNGNTTDAEIQLEDKKHLATVCIPKASISDTQHAAVLNDFVDTHGKAHGKCAATPVLFKDAARNDNCGSDKFRAFGQFLVSSLIEMGETDALRLVEKFTSDLVKALLAEQLSQTKQKHVNDVHVTPKITTTNTAT